MAVTLVSFGFKYGCPPCDKIYDCRGLVNPHHSMALRALNGKDRKVQDYIRKDPKHKELMDRVLAEIENGKTYGFGCHGGRHRSVAMVEMVRERLSRRGLIAHVKNTEIF